MIIFFIDYRYIYLHIDFLYSFYQLYKNEIKIIDKECIIETVKQFKNEQFIFINIFDYDLFAYLKYWYNISLYYYTDHYSQFHLLELNEWSRKIDFHVITQNQLYKYVHSIQITVISISKKVIEKIFHHKNKENGFIILRHVKNAESNLLWQHCIYQIRKFHNEKIVIVDDGSDPTYLQYNQFQTNENNIQCENVKIIESEFKKAGEILPYYYLYKYKLFDKCLILHDSTYLQKKILFQEYSRICYLWHFHHHANDYLNEIKMLRNFNDEKLIELYDSKKWYGCFGCQSIIEYSFLQKVEETYSLFRLIHKIDNRQKRMNFERILSVICTCIYTDLYKNKSIYGNIIEYQEWGFTFKNYQKCQDSLQDYDIIKTWHGR